MTRCTHRHYHVFKGQYFNNKFNNNFNNRDKYFISTSFIPFKNKTLHDLFQWHLWNLQGKAPSVKA